MNTKIPVTPMKAMNFNLSIFLTKIEGISKTEMTSAIKVRLVYHSFSIPGLTLLMMAVILSLKMMISKIQTPILLKKMKIDPKLLQNLFW